MKTKEDYIKEIAEQINKAKRFEIENPTLEDIQRLKEFEIIITGAKYFPVIIRKRFYIESFLGIPTVMWYDGYEIGDTVMGMIPYTFTAEEIIEEIKAFKEEEND